MAKKTTKRPGKKSTKKPVKTAPKKPARRTRRNSSQEAADKLFEKFHGAPPKGTKEIRQETEFQDKLAKLGKLLHFDILTPNEDECRISFSGPVDVCAEPMGNQLYIVGGNQKVDIEDLELGENESLKDYIFLGIATDIAYSTTKGFHDFEPTDYYHEFGEDNGNCPLLQYDRLNDRVFLTGGSYRVLPDGIVN